MSLRPSDWDEFLAWADEVLASRPAGLQYWVGVPVLANFKAERGCRFCGAPAPFLHRRVSFGGYYGWTYIDLVHRLEECSCCGAAWASGISPREQEHALRTANPDEA